MTGTLGSSSRIASVEKFPRLWLFLFPVWRVIAPSNNGRGLNPCSLLPPPPPRVQVGFDCELQHWTKAASKAMCRALDQSICRALIRTLTAMGASSSCGQDKIIILQSLHECKQP